MESKNSYQITFVPTDVKRVIARVKFALTKITDGDLEYYIEGKRSEFLTILQIKYNFSAEHADTFLQNVERLA